VSSLLLSLLAVLPLTAQQAGSTLLEQEVTIQQDKVPALEAKAAIAEVAR
jgi:hypothetical protein